ncbi:glycosyltransferase family 2 protein [Hymenobacter sp. BRD128]|uniref:glycosyltransferase family 2 protein n=1 Tax=Hymenobacter sp. BRD128 TaxID=2675878 RepID=UPI001566A002|nr:glycosyltransferase family 2 protein [Hymenobacter sp. BRD128]QKG58236.1 glycosyltransferase family 2 protein [Hymenobacter sp. BRD128]
MKFSIILINYNTFAVTCDCLRDIYSSNWDWDFEVILVDNASVECDPEEFKRLFPLINLIKNSENSGFARGNNLGIKIATGEYLLILNTDTINLRDGVAKCIQYMDMHKQEKDLAGVGCKILSLDGSMQRSAFDYRTGLKSVLLSNSIFSFTASKLGLSKYRKNGYMEAMHEKEHSIQAMLGAFMLLRREVVEKVKPFDPDFFMYCEEIELCYRIVDNGYRLMYTPDANIIHLGGVSSANTNQWEYNNRQNFLSVLLLIFKQHGYFGVFIFNVLYIVNFMTNIFLMPFRGEGAKINHTHFMNGTKYSLKYQKVMLKYFKPSFGSSKFPFKLSIVEEIAKSA